MMKVSMKSIDTSLAEYIQSRYGICSNLMNNGKCHCPKDERQHICPYYTKTTAKNWEELRIWQTQTK
jgi:hypothetical protein